MLDCIVSGIETKKFRTIGQHFYWSILTTNRGKRIEKNIEHDQTIVKAVPYLINIDPFFGKNGHLPKHDKRIEKKKTQHLSDHTSRAKRTKKERKKEQRRTKKNKEEQRRTKKNKEEQRTLYRIVDSTYVQNVTNW
jgi:hypothetical protein